MQKEKNIFLTSIAETKDRLDIQYFACANASGGYSYTTGISVAEAGVKYMLSTQHIDEIIVLGSAGSAGENEREPKKLSKIYTDAAADLNSMSEYAFLCYRIAEYLRQLDFEMLDIDELEGVDKKLLSKKLSSFFSTHSTVKDQREYFGALTQDKALAQSFEDELLSSCTAAEAKWLKHSLFTKMDSFHKLHVLADNKDSLMRFLPIEADGALDIAAITGVVESALVQRAQTTNLYLDMQGLGITDANTLISTFMLLNRRVGFDCSLHGLIHSHRRTGSFCGLVSNVKGKYDIQRLLSGIDLFLDHGKVTELRSCWERLDINDADAEKLFAGMSCVDEGVTLCNVDLIACGISSIRKIIAEPSTPIEEKSIYMKVLMGAIREDYGRMMEGDDLSLPELLRWCLRKGLYQQTLTLIESKVPGDMVARGIYYYAETQEDILEMMKALNILYWGEPAKMRWAFGDIEHYFIKTYGRFAVNFRQKPDLANRDYARLRIEALSGRAEGVLRAYSQLHNEDLLYELLLSYYRIGQLRNHVNHAVVDASSLKGEQILTHEDSRRELDTELGKFISLYASACKKTKKKKEVLLLPPYKMRNYIQKHELKLTQLTQPGIATSSYSCNFNGQELQLNITLLAPEEDIETDD